MPILSRVSIVLLVPVVALITLAFARGSREPPPAAESAALNWRSLHRHGGEARGPNGLGVELRGLARQGSRIYAMGPVESLRSEDGGATWVEVPRAQRGWDAAFGPDGLILIGGLDGKFSRSTDGGKSWKEIKTPADGPTLAIALDGQNAFAVGRSLLRSADAGESWRSVKAPKVYYFDIAARGQTVVAVGGAGRVMRSVDGGETWRERWLPSKAMLTSVAFADDRVIVIATSEGTLLRSTDAGASWATIPSRARALLRGIAFSDNGEGLAVGYWGEAIRTIDGGATWQRELSGTRLHLHDVAEDPTGGFLVSGVRETVFSVTSGGSR